MLFAHITHFLKIFSNRLLTFASFRKNGFSLQFFLREVFFAPKHVIFATNVWRGGDCHGGGAKSLCWHRRRSLSWMNEEGRNWLVYLCTRHRIRLLVTYCWSASVCRIFTTSGRQTLNFFPFPRGRMFNCRHLGHTLVFDR